MTNERPEENTNAIDGAGEESDFHQASAGKSLGCFYIYKLKKSRKKMVRMCVKWNAAFHEATSDYQFDNTTQNVKLTRDRCSPFTFH